MLDIEEGTFKPTAVVKKHVKKGTSKPTAVVKKHVKKGMFKPTAAVKKQKRIQFEHGNIYRFEIKKI